MRACSTVILSRADGEGSPATCAALVFTGGSFAVYAVQDDSAFLSLSRHASAACGSE